LGFGGSHFVRLTLFSLVVLQFVYLAFFSLIFSPWIHLPWFFKYWNSEVVILVRSCICHHCININIIFFGCTVVCVFGFLFSLFSLVVLQFVYLAFIIFSGCTAVCLFGFLLSLSIFLGSLNIGMLKLSSHSFMFLSLLLSSNIGIRKLSFPFIHVFVTTVLMTVCLSN